MLLESRECASGLQLVALAIGGGVVGSLVGKVAEILAARKLMQTMKKMQGINPGINRN